MLAAACLLGPGLAVADNNPPNITKGEVALLPEYCPDTQGFGYGDAYSNTSPRAAYWISLMGKTFWAMHHVCWAMIREHRSRMPGISPQMRAGHLRGANNDYDYVLQHAPPDFVLSPEIYTRIGDNHVALGNVGLALDSFTQARRLKPDYWPPYVSWAKLLVKIGKRGEALAHVEQVMKLAPDDAELKRQYALLKSAPAQSSAPARGRAPQGATAAADSAGAAASGGKGPTPTAGASPAARAAAADKASAAAPAAATVAAGARVPAGASSAAR